METSIDTDLPNSARRWDQRILPYYASTLEIVIKDVPWEHCPLSTESIWLSGTAIKGRNLIGRASYSLIEAMYRMGYLPKGS